MELEDIVVSLTFLALFSFEDVMKACSHHGHYKPVNMQQNKTGDNGEVLTIVKVKCEECKKEFIITQSIEMVN